MATRRQIRKAQHARSEIAQVFRALDNGQLDASDVLRTTPACLYRVRVYDVVRRLPHMGGEGAENVLRNARVWPLKRMGDLAPEDRRSILMHLPPRARK